MVKFKKEVIETTRHWAFFNPFRTLKSGKWYWQYAYINGNKETWSDILHFTISPQANTFNPPSLEFLCLFYPRTTHFSPITSKTSQIPSPSIVG